MHNKASVCIINSFDENAPPLTTKALEIFFHLIEVITDGQ